MAHKRFGETLPQIRAFRPATNGVNYFLTMNAAFPSSWKGRLGAIR